MGKLIKCHFYYLINKLTIVILLLSVSSVIFFSIFSAINIDERMNIATIKEDFYLSIYEVVRITCLIVGIMLFGYSFSSVQDGYRAIVINEKTSRTKYLVSKIITLVSVFTFLYLAVIAFVLIISLSFKIILDQKMIMSFYHLYVLLIFYSLLSTLLMIVVDNIYIVFILVPLTLINYDKKLSFLSFLIPLEDKTRSYRSLVLPVWYYLFILLVLLLVILLKWNHKDLPH